MPLPWSTNGQKRSLISEKVRILGRPNRTKQFYIMKCYVLLCFQYLLTSAPVDNPRMIHTDPTLHSTHVWDMQNLQVLNTPSPSNPYLLGQAISDGRHLALRVCSFFFKTAVSSFCLTS